MKYIPRPVQGSRPALALVVLFLLTWFWRTLACHNDLSLLSDRVAWLIGSQAVAAPGEVVPGGLTGRGQIVGLADSGLDAGHTEDIHPDFKSSPGQWPKVVMLKSWAGRSLPDDPVGHGTHLAGILVGTGAASGGKYRGIAPEASLYFQALLDGNGNLAVPSNLEELFRPAYEAGVRIHVDGWGGGSNSYTSASRQIDAFVRSHPDFLPIFGAGNNGPLQGTLTAEANSKNALVVGASESVRPALTPEAQNAADITSFSSRGPAADGRLKPDLWAPGSGLVAACSRLVESNFAAYPDYSLQSGTSQAAAVAGGAAVLLRQYLQEKGYAAPSAALLKAALIGGARPNAEASFPPSVGSAWGILDLAGTIFSLEEGMLRLAEESPGLAGGEVEEFSLEVSNPEAPLKVTLVWTDPPAPQGAASALVNDLDLVVVAPDGQEYLGNGQPGSNKPDRLNNVEQVYIKNPLPGRYTVKIIGAYIREAAVPGSRVARQDFALAYGQLLPCAVLAGVSSEGRLTLSDGREIPWPAAAIKNVVDGEVAPADREHLLPGSDVYLGARTLYVVGATWRAAGVQSLTTPRGGMVVEINREAREGGFYLHGEAQDNVFLEGKPVRLENLPAGMDVTATLNPSTGTIWRLSARATIKEGFVSRIDLAEKKIWLLGESQPYTLDPKVAISFADNLQYTSLADSPFGAADKAKIDQIWPGLAVRLSISSRNGQVTYLAVKRDLAVGRIAAVNPLESRITLETGVDLQLFPGAPLYRDGEKGDMSMLQPGDWIQALVLPQGEQVVALKAYSCVLYGRIIFLSRERNLAYFIDHQNRFHLLNLTPSTEIYRWGLAGEAESLTPGDWVRVVLQPGTDNVWRVDVAPAAEEKTGVLSGWDGKRGLVELQDGSSYPISSATLVTVGGYRVPVEDLPAGLKVRLVYLRAPHTLVLAQLTAEVPSGVVAPELKYSVLPRGQKICLVGNTTADKLYLYREDGRWEKLALSGDGYFSQEIEVDPGEKSLTLVALDRRTGAVTGGRIELGVAGALPFWDIQGHWAAEDIRELTNRGLLAGFEDGSFKPDLSVTRVEFVALLVRLAGWPTSDNPNLPFTDAASIPAWARGAVFAAWQRGLVVGFEDGTFRPAVPLTRAEAAALMVRYLGQRAPEPALNLPFKDWEQAPGWARKDLARAYAANLIRGVAPDKLDPLSPLTRAQAAAVLKRLLAW
ncbi:MAG: S8 family serine peptidase [Moorellaceae bacterium]